MLLKLLLHVLLHRHRRQIQGICSGREMDRRYEVLEVFEGKEVQKVNGTLMDNEKWTVEFGVEEILRTFDFEVDKYHPQFYHKTDKAVPSTLNASASLTSNPHTPAQPKTANSNALSTNTKPSSPPVSPSPLPTYHLRPLQCLSLHSHP
ncbi:hypothetical protein D9758_004528 [Tetrapyrgos nigripes]|uniref:Uncharacterized protein n=1 Tax=Tetrapyrgos nigripes TaxID=182062 RepID=A0A8H5H0E4_9AGAR|nr:hypothetical protein D9758_004528 [Tetrapyrgos nigripes]